MKGTKDEEQGNYAASSLIFHFLPWNDLTGKLCNLGIELGAMLSRMICKGRNHARTQRKHASSAKSACFRGVSSYSMILQGTRESMALNTGYRFEPDQQA
jgi:hypothetical protein